LRVPPLVELTVINRTQVQSIKTITAISGRV